MTTALDVATNLEMPGSPWSIQCQINKALQDACSPINRFAEIIERDAALATRVLAVANSAAYGHAETIGTIPDAIMLLGLQKIRDIVSVVLVIECFSELHWRTLNMESFARHSFSVGVAARLIATLRRDSRSEQHFLSGLIHDIGRLALYQKLPDRMDEVLAAYGSRDRSDPLHIVEKQVLGFDHAEVGAELLRLWRFPPSVCNAIRFHHEPWRSAAHDPGPALLHVADILSLCLGQGTTGETVPPPLQSAAWDRLKMPEGSLDQILPELSRQYEELSDIFEHSTSTMPA